MDAELVRLAAAHGVATWYEDGSRERVDVAPEVVAAVLAQLGVDTGSPDSVRRELAAVLAKQDERRLPATVVLREGQPRPLTGSAVVHLEDGSQRGVSGELPGDLPLGWHRVVADGRESTLVVAPRRLPRPTPSWGWMLQLYALHSAGSWGIGDLADLREFARHAGEQLGAGLVLVNPMHAMIPVLPLEPSPYSPSSRRFVNPLYLRVEDTPAYVRADSQTRARIQALRVPAGGSGLIDYDAVWTAKRAALELLWPLVEAEESADLDADPALRDFATFCAFAERWGPSWRQWPSELSHPDSPAVAAARSELTSRVAFHAWLQRLCGQQLGAARLAAEQAGMPVGLVHDLAIGVDPDGADGWALQDDLATGVTVGAPPDAFNQQGQNWGLPPWRPDRLAETGYRAYRDMLRAVLRHADGIRVDHVAGLWRLWWVPPGESPRRGTYVRYDAEAMLGILALEAHRAGAVVVGEDLGTIEPEVRTQLREQHMSGAAVLWFQRDETAPGEPLLRPARWPEQAMASISTHDLPTAAGLLRGEQVRVRAELGVLGRDVAEEQRHADAELAELISLLRVEGLLDSDQLSDENEIIAAMHGLLARTPCWFLLVSPYDVIGETRQPNLPGTTKEYPNWRIPLAVSLEELLADPRVLRVAALMRSVRPNGGKGVASGGKLKPD